MAAAGPCCKWAGRRLACRRCRLCSNEAPLPPRNYHRRIGDAFDCTGRRVCRGASDGRIRRLLLGGGAGRPSIRCRGARAAARRELRVRHLRAIAAPSRPPALRVLFRCCACCRGPAVGAAGRRATTRARSRDARRRVRPVCISVRSAAATARSPFDRRLSHGTAPEHRSPYLSVPVVRASPRPGSVEFRRGSS